MVSAIHPVIEGTFRVIGPQRILEVDADGAERVIEIWETSGETLSDETCREPQRTHDLIPFAESLRRVG